VHTLIEAEAPGKLVIAGEYAVLEGAPGLAVAVDVRAEARIQTLPGRGNQLVIPDTGAAFRFRWGAEGGLRFDGGSPGALGLPLEACAGVLAARGLMPRAAELPACRVELRTTAFHRTDPSGSRVKLGLGSSAAVIVALAGGLLRYASRTPVPRAELTAICCEAHRQLQGGSGSGIDVVTSLTGGVVGIDFPPGDQVPRATPLSWPRRLQMVAVWSGTSASTPAMLSRLAVFRDGRPAECATHMARLAAISGRVVAAFSRDDVQGVLAGLGEYEAALRHLDQAARIGILSPVHEQLHRIARARQAAYKPSGAGGGDFGIALTDSRDVALALRADYAAAGFACLDADLCAPGLTVRARGVAAPPA
jgi:phosphomevalonate kinase